MFNKLISKLFSKKTPEKAKDLGRNKLCWCGSGMKYKQCHYKSDQEHFQEVFTARCKDVA